MVSVLAWNILHGGGSRRTPAIALVLLEHDADVIVLTEFRSTFGGQIRGVLLDHGWRFQLSTDPPLGVNGVLIASKLPIAPLDESPLDGTLRHRWLAVEVPDLSLTVAGVHIPDEPKSTPKLSMWQHLQHFARQQASAKALILGDFNAGRIAQDEHTDSFALHRADSTQLGRLWILGYRDAWRLIHGSEREFTLFSHTGGGYRIDHAFVSDSLVGSVINARYSHDERLSGLSDHAAIFVEIKVD